MRQEDHYQPSEYVIRARLVINATEADVARVFSRGSMMVRLGEYLYRVNVPSTLDPRLAALDMASDPAVEEVLVAPEVTRPAP